MKHPHPFTCGLSFVWALLLGLCQLLCVPAKPTMAQSSAVKETTLTIQAYDRSMSSRPILPMAVAYGARQLSGDGPKLCFRFAQQCEPILTERSAVAYRKAIVTIARQMKEISPARGTDLSKPLTYALPRITEHRGPVRVQLFTDGYSENTGQIERKRLLAVIRTLATRPNVKVEIWGINPLRGNALNADFAPLGHRFVLHTKVELQQQVKM